MRSPLFVLAAVAVLALPACSGDDDSDRSAGERPSTTTTTIAAPAEVELTRGEAVVASAGAEVVLDETMQQAVVTAAQQYVDLAVLEPLAGGTVGVGYDGLFDTTVQASAIGADRAVLTDEGIPAPTATPTVTATPVRIDGLAAPDATIALLATSFDLEVSAETATGPIAVRRTTELTFAPGVGANWLVTAYRVTVERDFPETGTTTTTAAAG